MAAYIAGAGFPGHATRLTTRLQQGLARLVEALKARDEVTGSLPLAVGEHVLTTTCDSSGNWVAASERALYHHVRGPFHGTTRGDWVRVGWEEIGNVSWSASELTLTFTCLVPAAARRTVLHLPTGASLGLLAQERVSWTAVVRTEITLGEHGNARVIGRRCPGSDELVWLVGAGVAGRSGRGDGLRRPAGEPGGCSRGAASTAGRVIGFRVMGEARGGHSALRAPVVATLPDQPGPAATPVRSYSPGAAGRSSSVCTRWLK